MCITWTLVENSEIYDGKMTGILWARERDSAWDWIERRFNVMSARLSWVPARFG